MSIRSLVVAALTFSLAAAGPVAAAPSRPAPLVHPLPAGAVARFGLPYLLAAGAKCIALSPDSKSLVIVKGNRIHLLDRLTLRDVRHLTANRPWGEVAFGHDSKTLVHADGHNLTLLRASTGKPIDTFPGRTDFFLRPSFSADGKWVALGQNGPIEGGRKPLSVHVRRVGDRKQDRMFTVTQKRKVIAALSPDGKWLATWGFMDEPGPNGWVQLWDVASGKKRSLLRTTAAYAVCGAFSPDGKQFATVGSAHLLSVWDVATGKQLRLQAVGPQTRFLAYSPDGKALVTASNERIQLWSAATGERLGQCRSPEHTGLLSMSFLPANRLLAVGFTHQKFRLWEAPSGKEIAPVPGPRASVSVLAFTQDGKRLVAAAKDGVRVWQLATGRVVRFLAPRPEEQIWPMPTTSQMLSWDGTYVARAVKGVAGLEIVNLVTGEATTVPAAHSQYQNEPLMAAFSVTGNTFAALCTDHTVRIWATDSMKQLGSQQFPSATYFSRLALAGTSALAYVEERSAQAPDAKVLVWSLPRKKAFAQLHLKQAILAVAFSPDFNTLAVSHPGKVSLYRTADGGHLNSWELKGGHPFALAFSPDNRTLAIGIEELLLVEVASYQERTRFPGHGTPIRSVAFSHDGRLLATGADDTTAVVWDAVGFRNLPARQGKPSRAELSGWWADLQGLDAKKAHRAMAELTRHPAEALALFGKELKPTPGKPLTDAQIHQLITELGDDSAPVRLKAGLALVRATRRTMPLVLAAIRATSEPEKKIRLQKAVNAAAVAWRAERLRPLRAVEVLERLGTPEARRLLEALARGKKDDWFTVEAALTLVRLSRRQ